MKDEVEKLKKIETDMMYKLQVVITNHVDMDGDPLFDLATDLLALIDKENQKVAVGSSQALRKAR